MKPSVLYLLGSFLMLSAMTSGCKKSGSSTCNESIPYNSDTTNVTGIWELSETYNGFTGKTEPQAPCNGNRIIFGDSTYEQFSAWTSVKQGTYRIYPDSSIMQHRIQNRIVLNHDTINRQFITNNGSYMIIRMDAADGPASTYVRRAWPAD